MSSEDTTGPVRVGDVQTSGAAGEPASLRIEVDSDALSPAQQEALATLLGSGAAAAAIQPFGSLDEMLEAQQAEDLGMEFAWEDLPGAYVHIAHASAARIKYQNLEREFRAKHGKGWQDELTGGAFDHLIRDAYYGTVIKGWRGMHLRGKELPFSPESFKSMWGVRRFRDFVTSKAVAADEFRKKTVDEAGKS